MPATNAAIWFAADGYDPIAKGINGRRVAGESFLRGFFAHADVEEFVCLAPTSAEGATFERLARTHGVTRPVRPVRLHQVERIAPAQVLSYPSPLPGVEFWRRAPFGGAAWALCGITHTTATRAVMQEIFDMRAAPQMPWDAIICTSRAVQASLRRMMELAEEHLARRFPGSILPARPLVPVIPLGVHCDHHRPDPAAGLALRQRLGIAAADVVAAIVARLTPDEKFDPLPLFLAMEAAQPQIASASGRLHLVLCGLFRDEAWRPAFAEAAARLMPGVGYHVLDGTRDEDRRATMAAADMFLFPIDNVQETFGLAPIEAMAAGLPLIVSDWDGMKDTVTPDVGIRVPTEVPQPGATTYLAQRHLGGVDSYVQYVGQLSALTRVSVPALTEAMVRLGTDADLRRRMGAAGQARARELYDWRVVIPQIQALWAEQAAMLEHARTGSHLITQLIDPARLPVAPAPDQMFAAYPSLPAPDPALRRLRAVALGGRPDIAATFELRRYLSSRRLIDEPARLQALLDAFAGTGPAGTTLEAAAKGAGLPVQTAGRLSLWLLKYHFLEEAT